MPKFETSAADDEVLSSSELERNRIAWQDIIDRKLIEWFMHPEMFEDDGLVAPSRQIISEACKSIKKMSKEIPAPISVVSNGDGGIVFEWRDGHIFETIEIYADGLKEYCLFVNSRLRQRNHLE
jgi:hypothetical protein